MLWPSCENCVSGAKYNHVTLFNCYCLTPSRSLSMYEHRSTPKSNHLTFEGIPCTLMDSWKHCTFPCLDSQRCQRISLDVSPCQLKIKTNRKPRFILTIKGGRQTLSMSSLSNVHHVGKSPEIIVSQSLDPDHSARFRRSPWGFGLRTLCSGHGPERGPQRVCEMC